MYQCGYKPFKLVDEKEHLHKRYGLISSKEDCHDIIAHAEQASQGAHIFLTKDIVIHVEKVFAQPPRGEEAMVVALDEKNVRILVKWKNQAKGFITFQAYHVQFELKHSYFQSLHKALGQVTCEMIQRVMPHESQFTVNTVPDPAVYQLEKPKHDCLLLDKSGQFQALKAIINCRSQAPPVLVVGPFGTGKTRLLARATFEFLKRTSNRVLICAHHQASADTFVTEYFGKLKKDPDHPWQSKFLRIALNQSYISRMPDNLKVFYKTRKDIQTAELNSCHLVITTLGIVSSLAEKLKYKFTHILIDEGAQTREPDIIPPLCLAKESTKIVIAGDHCQVWYIGNVYICININSSIICIND